MVLGQKRVIFGAKQVANRPVLPLRKKWEEQNKGIDMPVCSFLYLGFGNNSGTGRNN